MSQDRILDRPVRRGAFRERHVGQVKSADAQSALGSGVRWDDGGYAGCLAGTRSPATCFFPNAAAVRPWPARVCESVKATSPESALFVQTMSVIVKHRTDLDVVAERVGMKLPVRAASAGQP